MQKIIRYEINPFTQDLNVNVKNKFIKVSNSNRINNDVWINNNTGEIAATKLYTYREVEDTHFVKLFTQNIGLAFNLTSAGIKALSVLIFSVQYKAITKDLILLDDVTLKEFLKKNIGLKLGTSTFYSGISELVKFNIIARYSTKGMFFINPNFVFNGDRVVFINAIKKKNLDETLEI